MWQMNSVVVNHGEDGPETTGDAIAKTVSAQTRVDFTGILLSLEFDFMERCICLKGSDVRKSAPSLLNRKG
jgi:hypothetical protein